MNMTPQSSLQIFDCHDDFPLEGGGHLPGIVVAYHVYGRPNADGSNYVWVCHALTANSDVADWWPGTVVAGRFLDPARYCVVCANILGSCYGTTGPLSVCPTTGSPWYGDFPRISVRDIVHAHQLLARHLGIRQVEMLIGSSIGGFQAIEWSILEPAFARKLVLIATGARCSPWAAAFNTSQRMAIEADATWGERSNEAGQRGMAAARSIALLSYRGGTAYCKTQDEGEPTFFTRKADSYQRHQGNKLVRRFNAYAYYRLTETFDSHDVGRGRGGVEAAVAHIKAQTLLVAISSDLLFPADEMQRLAQLIPHARFEVINSNFGHDGFLVESDLLDDVIRRFVAHGHVPFTISQFTIYDLFSI